ncbi:MAG: hypothetical protein OXT74_14110 [Candidatus Poribacteria bacterium]|nr:hypothetical protein [Candidatus Poribacteria bacterium]
MIIDITRQNGVSILKPNGRMLTEDKVRSFKKAIYREIPKNDPPMLIIDFGAVGMIGTA